MKLWLDDERPSPPGWWQVKTAGAAIQFLATSPAGSVTEVSLDHDLGEGRGTGYDVACWIEEAAQNGKLEPMVLACHSANPVGKERIEAAFRHARAAWAARNRT